MELISSYYFLKTNNSNHFRANVNQLNSKYFSVSSQYNTFKFINFEIYSNILFTGQKLFIDYKEFNVKLKKDFFLSNLINAKNNIEFNVKDANINSDYVSFNTTTNELKNNIQTFRFFNVNETSNFNKIDVNNNYILKSNITNIFTDINTNFDINVNSIININGNLISFYPKSLFKIACNEIEFISKNADAIIRRENFTVNSIHLKSNNNTRITSENTFFITENFNTKIKNLKIKGNIEIVLNENKPINLKTSNKTEIKNDTGSIQGFDHNFSLKKLNITSNKYTDSFYRLSLNANNIDINNNFNNIDTNLLFLSGNINLKTSNLITHSNFASIDANTILFHTKNYDLLIDNSSLLSRYISIDHKIISANNQSSSLKFISSNIESNKIHIQSNSVHHTNLQETFIVSNIATLSSNTINYNTLNLSLLNKNAFISNSIMHRFDSQRMYIVANDIIKKIENTINLYSYNLIDLYSNLTVISNTLQINGNVSINGNNLSIASNQSSLYANATLNITSNQITSTTNKYSINSNSSFINMEKMVMRTNGIVQSFSENVLINNNNFNTKSNVINIEGNHLGIAANIIKLEPSKIEMGNQKTGLDGDIFSIIKNNSLNVKGNHSTNVQSKSASINAVKVLNIHSNIQYLVSNQVFLKGNQIKINTPVLFNSNNFIFNKWKGLFLNNDHVRFSGNELSINGLFQTNINYSIPLKISGNANIQLSMVANANNTETSIKTDALHFNFGNTGTINSNTFILKTDDLSFNNGGNISIHSNSISIQSNLKGMLNTFDLSGNVLSLTSNSIQTFTSDFANQADAFDLISNTAILDTPQSFAWIGTNLNAAVNTVQQKSSNSSLNLNNGFFKSNSSIDASLQQSGITSNSFQIASVSIGSSALNVNLENKNKSTILLNQLNIITKETNMTSGNLVISENNDIRFNSNQTSKLVSKQSNISGNVLRLIQNELTFNTPIGVATFEKANIDSNIILIQQDELQLKTQFSKFQFENCNLIATVLNGREGMIDITNSNLKINSSSNLGIESADRFNISGKNLISKSSNVMFGTKNLNLISKNEFGLESNQYTNKCANADFQLAQLSLNTNKMEIHSNQMSMKQNKMTILSGKNQWNANSLNVSGNINLSSNNILLNSNKMRYTCTNFNLTNSENANIRSKSGEVRFGNLQITANQFVLSGVLSVFDVYYFYFKKDLNIKKKIYSSGLRPIGNKLDMINGEIFNISNGFYLKKSNIGYNNGSFNNLNVNIGTDSCTLNIQGVINYINDPNYEIDSKHLFLNSNANGSGTAPGAGFYLKDNGNINQSYVLVNGDSDAYIFKSPESEKILQLNFPSFTKSGFVKSLKQGTNPIYNLVPEAIEINNVVQLESRLNNQLNLSGGVMTGNIMMGSNKIISAYNVENANDLTNQMYANTKLSLSGGIMNGTIIMSDNIIKSSYEAVSASDLVNKQYYDVNKLALSGGIMSGNIVMGNNYSVSSNYNASANLDLTNKKYMFDNKLPFSGGTMLGNIIMGDTFKITSNFLAVGSEDLTSKEFVDKTSLKLAGGIMQGNINSGLNKITSNFYPAVNSDLTNKLYLNDKLFPLSGGSLSGNIDMGINKITSNVIANANSDITNKKFLDNTILAFSGGIMTGNIIMGTFKITSNFSAVANADLTNKKYVDLNVMPLVGGIMKGNITMNGDQAKITSNFYANANSDLTNKKYIDDTMLSLSGGMMNGNIIMSALFKLTSNYTPVGNSDITNKKHLDDNQLALAGGIMNGNIFMGNNKITSNFLAVANSDLTSKSFLDLQFLKLSGGSMKGSISMGENTKITSKIVPSALFDLTNKQFVDTKCNISGSGDPITGNLTLKSNLILDSQYSNITSKSGNIFFTGNVSMLSNVNYGRNLSTQFLPVSLNYKYIYHYLSNNAEISVKEIKSVYFTTTTTVLPFNVTGGFYVNPEFAPAFAIQPFEPSSIQAEIWDATTDTLVGSSTNTLNCIKNTTFNIPQAWAIPTFETAKLTFYFNDESMRLIPNKSYYVKFKTTNDTSFNYLSFRQQNVLPILSGALTVLESPIQDNQLVNKLYMDTKSNGITKDLLIKGNLILNNGLISKQNNNLTLDAKNLYLYPNRTVFTNNIFSNNSILEIGAPDKNLRILGAINKGSLLVGNTATTMELPVGSNNKVLKTIINPKIQLNVVGLNYEIIYLDANGSVLNSNQPVPNGSTVYKFNANTTTTGSITSNYPIQNVSYLVVGGGGGGGSNYYNEHNQLLGYGGGGGGGGFLTTSNLITLNSGIAYNIVIGGGGSTSSPGTSSSLNYNGGSISVLGGSAGGSSGPSGGNGGSSGANGGGGGCYPTYYTTLPKNKGALGGTGSTGGYSGGGSLTIMDFFQSSGGGGGAGADGTGGSYNTNYNYNSTGGLGGSGKSSSITGTSTFYGGGGGGNSTNHPGMGGAGGGGNGGSNGATGFGGGGGAGASGGSGVIILRFPSIYNYDNIGWDNSIPPISNVAQTIIPTQYYPTLASNIGNQNVLKSNLIFDIGTSTLQTKNLIINNSIQTPGSFESILLQPNQLISKKSLNTFAIENANIKYNDPPPYVYYILPKITTASSPLPVINNSDGSGFKPSIINTINRDGITPISKITFYTDTAGLFVIPTIWDNSGGRLNYPFTIVARLPDTTITSRATGTLSFVVEPPPQISGYFYSLDLYLWNFFTAQQPCSYNDLQIIIYNTTNSLANYPIYTSNTISCNQIPYGNQGSFKLFFNNVSSSSGQVNFPQLLSGQKYKVQITSFSNWSVSGAQGGYLVSNNQPFYNLSIINGNTTTTSSGTNTIIFNQLQFLNTTNISFTCVNTMPISTYLGLSSNNQYSGTALNDGVDTMYPVLTSNFGKNLTQIQSNKTNLPNLNSTTTTTILRMDLIKVGDTVSLNVANASVIAIGAKIQLSYNSTNIILGQITSKTTNTISLTISNIQTDATVIPIFDNTSQNKDTPQFVGFNLDKLVSQASDLIGSMDFNSIQGATSNQPITYTLCDSTGNILPSTATSYSYITIQNNKINLNITGGNPAFNGGTILYTIRASISDTDYVLINLNIAQNQTANKQNLVNLSFSNNSSKSSQNISWNVPTITFYLNQFQFITILKTQFVMTTISRSVCATSSSSGSINMSLNYKYNIYSSTFGLPSIGSSSYNYSQENLSDLSSQTIDGSSNVACVIPSTYQFLIQLVPSTTTQKPNYYSYQYFNLKSSNPNTLIGKIMGYSIDYTSGTIVYENSNSKADISYTTSTQNLYTYNLSTQNCPLITRSIQPSASNQLVPNSYIDAQLKGSVNAINFKSNPTTTSTQFLPLINQQTKQILTSPNLYYNENKLNANIISVQSCNSTQNIKKEYQFAVINISNSGTGDYKTTLYNQSFTNFTAPSDGQVLSITFQGVTGALNNYGYVVFDVYGGYSAVIYKVNTGNVATNTKFSSKIKFTQNMTIFSGSVYLYAANTSQPLNLYIGDITKNTYVFKQTFTSGTSRFPTSGEFNFDLNYNHISSTATYDVWWTQGQQDNVSFSINCQNNNENWQGTLIAGMNASGRRVFEFTDYKTLTINLEQVGLFVNKGSILTFHWTTLETWRYFDGLFKSDGTTLVYTVAFKTVVSTGNVGLIQPGTSPIQFNGNLINNNNHLGIGTSNPNYPLDIKKSYIALSNLTPVSYDPNLVIKPIVALCCSKTITTTTSTNTFYNMVSEVGPYYYNQPNNRFSLSSTTSNSPYTSICSSTDGQFVLTTSTIDRPFISIDKGNSFFSITNNSGANLPDNTTYSGSVIETVPDISYTTFYGFIISQGGNLYQVARRFYNPGSAQPGINNYSITTTKITITSLQNSLFQSSPTNQGPLMAMAFTPQILYIVGGKTVSCIFKCTNIFTSLTYTPLILPTSMYHVSVACSENGQIVYVCSTNGYLWKSIDGGSSFTYFRWKSTQPVSQTFSIINGMKTFYAVGGIIPIPESDLTPIFNTVSCDNTGDMVSIGLGSNGPRGIYNSNDGGKNWKLFPGTDTLADQGYGWISICTVKNNPNIIIAGLNKTAYTINLINLSMIASGKISCSSTSQITVSDKRMKTNISNMENLIEPVRLLRPKKYQMIEDKSKYIGFIAQDVDKYFPNIVSKMTNIIPNFMKRVLIMPSSDLKHIFPEKSIYIICSTDPWDEFNFIGQNHNQRFKIKIQNMENQQTFYVWTVQIRNKSSFYIEADADDSRIAAGKHLLVGQEIFDLHSINIDFIHTIGFNCIQQISRNQQDIQKQITNLQNKVISLEKLIEKQDKLIESIQ